MKYFYSSATMGFYGEGYWWHKLISGFPELPFVAKTITYKPKRGKPYNFFPIPFAKSMWNKIGLHNNGFHWWCQKYLGLDREIKQRLIPSLAGNDSELRTMISTMHKYGFNFPMVELNLSCPNIISHENKRIPDSPFPLSLKLSWMMDPYLFAANSTLEWNTSVKRITLNSVPASIATGFINIGAISGKWAKKYNWHFIASHIEELKKEGISVAGSSITCLDDVHRLEEMGVTEIALGSILFTRPLFVKKLLKEN